MTTPSYVVLAHTASGKGASQPSGWTPLRAVHVMQHGQQLAHGLARHLLRRGQWRSDSRLHDVSPVCIGRAEGGCPL